MSQHPSLNEIAVEAKNVRAQLQELWADEGIDQLSIFLDPAISVVLEEIKRVSMEFVDRVAALSD